MRNKIFGALALSTLAALSLGGAALAKGGPGHHGGKGIFGPGMHHVLAELDLSEEQQALAKELRDEARANHESERAEREQAMDSALTELAKAEPDSAALHAIVDQQLATMSTRMHDGVDAFLTLHATFTEAQRATLVSELEDRRDEALERRDEFDQRRAKQAE
ncbi:MAG: periplasmic heavy metal sensor [Myxococcota bacterium]|nr:periplasmic heavy metal sensor [Myxococcota bacterium]